MKKATLQLIVTVLSLLLLGASAIAADGAKPNISFSLASYDSNKKAYLKQVVPDRAFQYARGGLDVRTIQAASSTSGSLQPSDTMDMSVRAVPGAPVTFTSVGLGAFQNGRSSITVEADGQGVARVRFEATKGTEGKVPIYAASPMTKGQVLFRLSVEPPASEPAE